MSKRNLKKNINAAIELLYIDCVFYKVFVVDADIAAVDKIIDQINDAHTAFIQRINVNEGKEVKGRVKAYYKKLKSDFKVAIDAIAKEISQLP